MTIDDFPTDEFHRAREHFNQLLDLDAEQRHARLQALHREAPELAKIVTELLAYSDHPEQIEERPPFTVRHGLAEGDVVAGRYRIERLIGEGGMAEVYLARRIDGIDQQVALKLVRGGSRMMVQRFVRERQILARLSHPRIAHLTDGGLTDDGLPWFAMEYIRGEPIHTWCDRQRLELRERARLFARVCRAVQFAHRNLVLHRDLKPSNILVDDLGQPYLLDFGIAKLIDATDPDKTQTVAMTPAYAAPEQLRGQAVSTASDIYQLGLVLRQLLTGTAPCSGRHGGPDDIRSLPRLDQTFAAYSADEAEQIAKARNSQPARLKRALRGDLERIVRRATAADPRERYETAQALADDLDRWRQGLPVNAHGGSFGYRAGKLLRRHAIAASIVFLCAAGLIASSIYSWQRATGEFRERQRAETMLDFMRDIFRQAEPDVALGRVATPVEMLERASAELISREDIDEITLAALQVELARIFFELSQFESAGKNIEQAIKILDPVREQQQELYLQAANQLIQIHGQLYPGQYDFDLINRALSLSTGRDDWYPLFLRFRGDARFYGSNELDEGENDIRAAISEYERQNQVDSTGYAGALNALAIMRAGRGKLSEGIQLMERVVEIADRSPEFSAHRKIIAAYTLAYHKCASGLAYEALDEAKELLNTSVKLLGDSHDRTIIIHSLIANCYLQIDEYELAINQLEIAESLGYSFRNPTIYQSIELTKLRIGSLYGYDESIAQALQSFIEFPSETPVGQRAQIYVADMYLQVGDCVEARRCLEEAMDTLKVSLESTESIGFIGAIVADRLGRCNIIENNYQNAILYLENSVSAFYQLQGLRGLSYWKSRIHLLWAKFLETRNTKYLSEIEKAQTAISDLLETREVPSVLKVDLLLCQLSKIADDEVDEYCERADHAAETLKLMEIDFSQFTGIPIGF